MKLKLGSTLILGFGGLLAIGLSYLLHSSWYLAVLVPFVIWAWLYAFEEINEFSWHYALADRYFEMKEVPCKACPYWGVVALSIVFFVVQFAYLVVLQLLIYLWHSVWLMFGFRPKWSVIAYDRIHGKVRYMYKRQPQKRDPQYDDMIHTGVRPTFTFAMIFVVIALLGFNIITGPLHTFYHGNQWYFTAPATYLAVLACAGLMELWLVTGWPATKWAYSNGCPDVKFVKKAPATAKPERPSRASA